MLVHWKNHWRIAHGNFQPHFTRRRPLLGARVSANSPWLRCRPGLACAGTEIGRPEVIPLATPPVQPATPADGLTYNLRLGTTPGGSELLSPMANPGDGYRRVPRLGNTGHETSWEIVLPNPLPTTVYWSVQAVDAAWAGGP